MNNEQKYKVTVSAESFFIPEQSNPDQSRYLFAYRIRIQNTGNIRAQLLSRHWIITDANDKVDQVRGEGVVGEFPNLHPGESFEYTSAASIDTPVGLMEGSYKMRASDGIEFDAQVPQFTLSVPRVLH
ncbi:MAG: Co2+/Mg2+ efflux protein ApaG [Betaproteobacteria bacterium]|jgi:ApaG protein|nr:Co2+/Mg2+ efflux protein ApaG [Betaproteobacteria bacterium]MDC1433818.1 Co2+/Mg2+ efflux protein ApaG [Burkholderiales bacterium]MBT5671636.1 Co2+/Mg2+ efflux protein ApaG [Betaproteobacteria bacterium]MBT6183708.1 Co2+/Mg2+ efflux protein ApaG [Betaproteobacteria bacterium]MBT6530909.1 Co2+/Mg2+ efflux protein ApaG [Betaproteobacteria bacterium]